MKEVVSKKIWGSYLMRQMRDYARKSEYFLPSKEEERSHRMAWASLMEGREREAWEVGFTLKQWDDFQRYY